MVGTVVQLGGQAHHRVAGQHAVLDVVAQALFDRGDEVARHHAAHDRVLEVELGIGRVVVGTELDPHVAELAVSAGLLLVAALHVDLLADGLAVGDLRELQHALRAELAGQLLGDDFQMQLAQAGEHALGGFHVLFHADGRVFLHQAAEAGEDLVFLARLFGVHGHGDAGRRELEVFKLHGLVRVAQRVAGGDAAQLGDGADVARAHLLRRVLLAAAQEVDVAGLFGLFRVGVVKRRAGSERAGSDLQKRQLAHERVGQRLEHAGGEGLIVGADALLSVAALGVDALERGARRGGHEVDEVVQQLGKAHARQRRAAHHRHHRAVLDALTQAVHDLFLGKLAFLEVLLHQFVLGAGRGFHDGFAGALDVAGHIGGDVDLLEGLALAGVGLVLQNADNAGELAALHDRHLNGRDVAAILVGDGGKRAAEVGVLAIHLVDDDHARSVGLVAQIPRLFRAHVQAGNRAHGDDRALGHGHGADHFAGEIEVAGHVDQIDLDVLPLEGSDGGADGDLAALLLLVAVGHRVAILDAALTVDGAAGVQQGLDQRGLALAAVSDDGDIADVLGLIVLHVRIPPVRL